jgi:hypothetical protein
MAMSNVIRKAEVGLGVSALGLPYVGSRMDHYAASLRQYLIRQCRVSASTLKLPDHTETFRGRHESEHLGVLCHMWLGIMPAV